MTSIHSTYRAVLRELPRRSLSSPTPLHQRIRTAFRTPMYAQQSEPATATDTDTSSSNDSSNASSTLTQAQYEASVRRRLDVAEQMALYARAQRSYADLVERYNPGMTMDEKEKIRLTARRVGWDLPVEVEGDKEGEK